MLTREKYAHPSSNGMPPEASWSKRLPDKDFGRRASLGIIFENKA
jgi:hypothetical protein